MSSGSITSDSDSSGGGGFGGGGGRIISITGLPDEPLGTLAIVALCCYLGLSSLYFVVIHAWPGYHGPALFWREETITITQSSPNDEHLPESDSTERSNEPIAPQSERETRAKPERVAKTEVVITAPTLRWAEITLRTAAINAMQASRGPASLAMFFGASVSQIFLFLQYVDALVGFAGVMSSLIGFISLMALVCFVQSMRMMYQLNYLVMVMPRRDKTKDEIAAEALGLAVGIADHTTTEMERQGQANAMKDELVDQAASAMLEASRSVSVMSMGGSTTGADFAAATILLEDPSLVLQQTANQLRLRRPKPLRLVPHDATAALVAVDPATAAIIRDEDARRPQTPGVDHLLRRRVSRGGIGFETASERASSREAQDHHHLFVSTAVKGAVEGNEPQSSEAGGRSLTTPPIESSPMFGTVPSPMPQYAIGSPPPLFKTLAASIGRELRKPTMISTATNPTEPQTTTTNTHLPPLSHTFLSSSTPSSGGDALPLLQEGATHPTPLPLHSPSHTHHDSTSRNADDIAVKSTPAATPPSLHRHAASAVSLATVSVLVGEHHHPHSHSAGGFMDESTDDIAFAAVPDDAFHHHDHHHSHVPKIDVENVAIANLLVGPAPAQDASLDASPIDGPPPPGLSSTQRQEHASSADAAAVIELTKKQQYAAKILAHLALEEHYSFREHELRLSEVARLMSWNCALGLRLMVLLLPPVLGLFHEGALLAASVLVMPLLVYVDACY